MRHTLKKITFGVGLIAILLLVFMSGFYFGYKRINKRLSEVVQGYDEEIVQDLRFEFKSLKYLRAGEINSCIKTLEFRLDNDVVYLVSRLKDRDCTPQLKKEVIKYLREAKKYREQYPNPNYKTDYKPGFKTEVENAFKEISGE